MAKKAYVGVMTDIPIYSEETKTVDITASNISDYFTVTNGTYYFVGSGSSFTSDSYGGDTSVTTFTAKRDIEAISFEYGHTMSPMLRGFFLLEVGGNQIYYTATLASNENTYTGSLKAGDSIHIEFNNKASSATSYNAYIRNIAITIHSKTLIGTETKEVARRARKMYIGVDGIARKIKKAYVGVNNIARLFFFDSMEMVTGTVSWKKDNVITIQTGFTPKYVMIWGYSTATSSNNYTVSIYDNGNEPLWIVYNSNWDKPMRAVSNSLIMSVSDTSFTIDDKSDYLPTSYITELHYIAFG